MPSTRTCLTADTSYFVNNTTGSDNNSGSSGSPFATLQFAWDHLSSLLDGRGHQVTINLAGSAVAYNLQATGAPWVGVSQLNIIGAGSASTIISNPYFGPVLGAAGGLSLGTVVSIDSVTLQDNGYGMAGGACLVVQASGVLVGQSANDVVIDSTPFQANTYAQVFAFGTGSSVAMQIKTIKGNAARGLWADLNSNISLAGATSVAGSAYGVAFAVSDANSLIQFSGSFSGSATGPRYYVNSGGAIVGAQPDDVLSPTLLPGSAAGSAISGGIYGS